MDNHSVMLDSWRPPIPPQRLSEQDNHDPILDERQRLDRLQDPRLNHSRRFGDSQSILQDTPSTPPRGASPAPVSHTSPRNPKSPSTDRLLDSMANDASGNVQSSSTTKSTLQNPVQPGTKLQPGPDLNIFIELSSASHIHQCGKDNLRMLEESLKTLQTEFDSLGTHPHKVFAASLATKISKLQSSVAAARSGLDKTRRRRDHFLQKWSETSTFTTNLIGAATTALSDKCVQLECQLQQEREARSDELVSLKKQIKSLEATVNQLTTKSSTSLPVQDIKLKDVLALHKLDTSQRLQELQEKQIAENVKISKTMDKQDKVIESLLTSVQALKNQPMQLLESDRQILQSVQALAVNVNSNSVHMSSLREGASKNDHAILALNARCDNLNPEHLLERVNPQIHELKGVIDKIESAMKSFHADLQEIKTGRAASAPNRTSPQTQSKSVIDRVVRLESILAVIGEGMTNLRAQFEKNDSTQNVRKLNERLDDSFKSVSAMEITLREVQEKLDDLPPMIEESQQTCATLGSQLTADVQAVNEIIEKRLTLVEDHIKKLEEGAKDGVVTLDNTDEVDTPRDRPVSNPLKRKNRDRDVSSTDNSGRQSRQKKKKAKKHKRKMEYIVLDE